MGRQGLGPKEIELGTTYRVEEYIDGRPLTMLELRNPYIVKKIMHMLCETNYDPALTGLIEKAKNADTNHSIDFIRD
jgi:hypothetical protein